MRLGVLRSRRPYLFLLTSLLCNELVEHGPKFFMNFLHFIDMTCNLVHGLDGHWKKTGRKRKGYLEALGGDAREGGGARGPGLTVQMVVLLALRVRQGEELLQQQRVLEDPLDGLDEVRLEGGRVLLFRVLGV